ncbi:MAG: T9SS type A sorting domain-containing protein [Candidatus Zixiibacteriota bacterium]
MTVEPYINPAYLWDDGGTPTIQSNQNFIVEIMMDNPDGYDRAGMSIPLTFYLSGDLNSWTNVSHEGVNGFESSSTWWPLINIFTLINWDGNTADTINWTGSGITGMPNGSPLLTRFKYEFNITADVMQNGVFCVDSCSIPDMEPAGKFDWLFEDPSPDFGGPYCWPVKSNCPVPQFANCPVTDISHGFDAQFTYDFNTSNAAEPVFELISGPGSINSTTGVWIFDPECSDVGSHDVVVGLSDNVCPGLTTTCEFTVTVTDTPPVITGPCGDTAFVYAGMTSTFQFAASDANAGDVITWTVNTTQPLDGTYTINQEGRLTITPSLMDEGMVGFQVYATDCAGQSTVCVLAADITKMSRFEIKIEKIHDQLQGHHAYVDVINSAGVEILNGFDFLIGYDPSALTFVAAMAGPLFTIPGTYEWEYFTYRYNYMGNCGSGCPSGLLRVVGMAEYNDGAHHPKLMVLPTDLSLFTLDFLVSGDYNLAGMFVPINFYWMDCGDNAIAFHYRSDNPLNIQTGLSFAVYQYGGFSESNPYNEITNENTGFPTYTGAQAECFANSDPTKPIAEPFVDFYGGGIDIIPTTEIDLRADVNLNGVAYEIADAVVFTNYFIYGLSAFTVNIEGQKAATEINGDGIALTIADLVYLIRVIVGDAMPIPKVAPDIRLNVVADGQSVTIDAEIGAAYFIFDGEVPVALGDDATGMELAVNSAGGRTVALLYSFEKDLAVSGQVLNTPGNLISVEAADYNGNTYTAKIVPAGFHIRSYPNPFNPVTTLEMSLPAAGEWDISIFNITGQRIATFNGYSEAGIVNVVWDASKFASGIYFYQARAGNFSATEKLMLVK